MTATKIAIPSIQPSAMPSLMHPITNDTKAAAHNSLKMSSSKQPTILEKKIQKINIFEWRNEEHVLKYWFICFFVTSSHRVLGGLVISSLWPNLNTISLIKNIEQNQLINLINDISMLIIILIFN
jgi:hypothetical protein